ncbi:glycine cleavage system aminomethyltransferase GcvT [Alkaliphilus peptidifermentans]|uniref:Aminomethyltransferase n=1 Tax=Alkaliphilus peptidifermentans DSM 18978 TaxID=1120976 RepID=A0A1G5FHF7_9FIRM|nr:glycine cleavage system aminomethyltransferase GcvT [Alkaliphilus peptidifermentans]SCY38310.1 aminomethyltransferase [Alkaliphilus peptidifermentans DSM 18978]
MSELKRTSLFQVHQNHGGKLVDYSGWSLPVQYEGITAEHEAVRTAVGLFDVSHMGEVEVKGSDAEAYLQNLVTNDVSILEDNQVLYTFMCYPHGGIVDDLLVYKYSKEHYLLVINAGNIDKDFSWMKDNKRNYDVELNNISEEISEIAIQGPKAEEVLQKLTNEDLSRIGFFYCKQNIDVAGAKCLISRTGYTGEDGFEIYLNHQDAEKVWKQLMEAGEKEGIKPAGLGARDTLRFEATLPLYGNEISEKITPLEAGLGFFVKLNKENFIGKEALVKQKQEGLKRKIVGFEMVDKGIPRNGYEIVADNGQIIGFVTTGYQSPTLKRTIGLAIVDADYNELDTPINVQVRNRLLKAKVISKRFYQKNYKK